MLGEMAAVSRLGSGPHAPASFSNLSANPGAVAPDGEGAAPCVDCADSYGVAMRLRAQRDDRMSDEFRELGSVETDTAPWPDPRDDYRYGGRFPDPEPAAEAATSDDPHAVTPASETAPADETAPVPAELLP